MLQHTLFVSVKLLVVGRPFVPLCTCTFISRHRSAWQNYSSSSAHSKLFWNSAFRRCPCLNCLKAVIHFCLLHFYLLFIWMCAWQENTEAKMHSALPFHSFISQKTKVIYPQIPKEKVCFDRCSIINQQESWKKKQKNKMIHHKP